MQIIVVRIVLGWCALDIVVICRWRSHTHCTRAANGWLLANILLSLSIVVFRLVLWKDSEPHFWRFLDTCFRDSLRLHYTEDWSQLHDKVCQGTSIGPLSSAWPLQAGRSSWDKGSGYCCHTRSMLWRGTRRRQLTVWHSIWKVRSTLTVLVLYGGRHLQTQVSILCYHPQRSQRKVHCPGGAQQREVVPIYHHCCWTPTSRVLRSLKIGPLLEVHCCGTDRYWESYQRFHSLSLLHDIPASPLPLHRRDDWLILGLYDNTMSLYKDELAGRRYGP